MTNPNESAYMRAAHSIGHALRRDCCGHDTNDRERRMIAGLIEEELAPAIEFIRKASDKEHWKIFEPGFISPGDEAIIFGSLWKAAEEILIELGIPLEEEQ